MITPKKLVKEKALQKLLAVMDRVHEANEGVSEEDIVRYATQAIHHLITLSSRSDMVPD